MLMLISNVDAKSHKNALEINIFWNNFLFIKKSKHIGLEIQSKLHISICPKFSNFLSKTFEKALMGHPLAMILIAIFAVAIQAF